MKRLFILFVAISAAILALSYLPAGAEGKERKFFRSANGIPGRYIVVFKSTTDQPGLFDASAEATAFELASAHNAGIDFVYDSAVKGFSGRLSDEDAQRLSADPRVAFVEQDSYAYVSQVQNASDWGLDRIDQRELPLNGAFVYSQTGAGVNAYIIDTGIRPTHQDFGGRAVAAFDAVGDGQNGLDCHGHGTHVAGTIGSTTYGVAKNVNLYGVRVFGCGGSGTVSGIISGVNWITANRVNPAVVNMSIIVSTVSQSLNSAINTSINSGVTYVVAAGNYNMDACNFSPGSVTNAVTVGATGHDDSKASYSNYGGCVDIWAPGNGITSLGHTSDTSTAVKSGTSMASPMVAGAAALYLESNPSASPAQVASRLLQDSTQGMVTNLDPVSPNKLLYSWVGVAAPPTPGSVTIIKQVTAANGSTASSTAFSYSASNLGTSSFSLVDNDVPGTDRYTNANVVQFGTENTVTVTEGLALGWQLTSINCVETGTGGLPNLQNSTVDLAAKRANIVVEEGESVTCTFASSELTPTAAPASITGRVVGTNGHGLRGASLTLVDLTTGERYRTASNSFGYYTFRELAANRVYVLAIAETKRSTFAPDTMTINLMADMFDINFYAVPR